MADAVELVAAARAAIADLGGIEKALEVAAMRVLFGELWRQGEAWQVVADEGQFRWLSALRGDVDRQQRAWRLWRISRQRGKSWAAILFALCEMRRRPGIIVRYAALTAKSAASIVGPTVRAILEMVPEEYWPRIDETKGVIADINGSTLTWAGTDNEQFDRLRGPRAHMVLLDESAFYADLESVERALLPQLTTTHGVVLYLSSPPESPAHPWAQRDAAAQAADAWTRETIHDNPRLGPEGVAAIERSEAERLGLTVEQLRVSTYWRREYLAEILTEESRAALPAWTMERAASLVGEWVRPAHFDAYTILDPGKVGDPHAALFVYLDMTTGYAVIEDELELRSASHTVAAWAKAIKDKERELWGVDRWEGTLLGVDEWRREVDELPEYLRRVVATSAPRQPFLRAGDNEHLTLNTLNVEHGLAVCPVPKHEKHLAVDTLNNLIVQGKIRVHSRCVRLREQLLSTLWNRTRTAWERTDKDHGDLVDCAVYFARICRWHRDTRPKPRVEEWTGFPMAPAETRARSWETAFKRRR